MQQVHEGPANRVARINQIKLLRVELATKDAPLLHCPNRSFYVNAEVSDVPGKVGILSVVLVLASALAGGCA